MITSRNISTSAVAAALCLFSMAATAQPALSVTAKPPAVMADSGDAVATAAKDYRASGIARIVVQGDFVTFPFGHAQPTLTCAVLRACVIELEAGEIVLSRIAGDTERWEISPATAGVDGKTPLIVVKPRDCDITTNVVLATDRRLYDLTLDSPPCKARVTNPQQTYARHVRFYYPDETVATWSKPVAEPPVRIAPDALALNFHYEVKKDRQFPWAPDQVFDDGARVYIKLPQDARSSVAPVLFVLEGDGAKTLVNYSFVGGDTYVTDRLFDRAELVAGIDGKERRAVIERKEGRR
ncbi:MAG TPA: TrbG/VirB9 family P-type conjugative transfer protein [Gemmatimonadaceae bacterium]|jgi:type IV secretion system protein VirB9|nr:TrbG/VirB9 family P-type conjugative transfer protein [Gemmatimonadaceae bacterium]